MRCRGGNCDNGETLKIEECNTSRIRKFDFISVGSNDEVLIKAKGSGSNNKCLERSGKDIKLRTCDEDDSKQRWYAKRGAFDEYR